MLDVKKIIATEIKSMSNKEMVLLSSLLIDDVICGYQSIGENPSDFEIRNFVRCIAAGIEGLIAQLKNNITDHAQTIPNITIHERAALEEESYFIDSAGTVKTQSKYIPITLKVKLIAKILHRFEQDFEIEFSGHGWESFKIFGPIRNRLVHPKTAADLNISKEDLVHCQKAFWWTMKLAISGFGAHSNHLKEIYSKASKNFNIENF